MSILPVRVIDWQVHSANGKVIETDEDFVTELLARLKALRLCMEVRLDWVRISVSPTPRRPRL